MSLYIKDCRHCQVDGNEQAGPAPTKDPKNSIRNILKLINELRKVTEYKINAEKLGDFYIQMTKMLRNKLTVSFPRAQTAP